MLWMTELGALDYKLIPRLDEKLTRVCKLQPALNFTAAGCHQIAGQHCCRALSRWDGTVNQAEAARWSKIDPSVTLTWIYCGRLFLRLSLVLQPNHQHQRRVLQIAGVKGLRPRRDGFILSSSLMRCPIYSGASRTCNLD